MSITQRSDIRRRALRAAAQVAMLGGAGLACGTTPLEQLQAQAPDPEDAGVARAEGQAVDAGVIVVGDAGVVPDTGLEDAGLVDGGEFCDRDALTPEDYYACCEQLGWNWDQGCAAWGPPAPPEVA